MDDQHPADGLIQDIQGLFNGSTFVKGIRDAWDKHFGTPPAPEKPADQPLPAAWEDANKRAQQQALTPATAAKIRTGSKSGR